MKMLWSFIKRLFGFGRLADLRSRNSEFARELRKIEKQLDSYIDVDVAVLRWRNEAFKEKMKRASAIVECDDNGNQTVILRE